MSKAQIPTLAVNDQLEIAGALVIRSRVFFDAWYLSAGFDGRSSHFDFWDEYWAFWRFNEHALLFAFIVHMAGLFETREDTVNLRQIWVTVKFDASEKEKQEAEKLLQDTSILTKAVMMLRNNAMAHRSASLSYNSAFDKAQVTPDQLRQLNGIAFELVNIMRSVVGLKKIELDYVAIGRLQALANVAAPSSKPLFIS